MLLLASTPLHIFLVDVFNHKYSIVRAGDGYYYGITYRDGVFALTHSGGYLQIYSPGTKLVSSTNHLIQPHQAEWIENEILVANTGLNCLSVFDPKGNPLRDVYLNDTKQDNKDRSRIGNHFNSIHKINHHVFVVAHNYDKPSEVYKLDWPELKITEILTSSAGWAHNIWACESGLVVCDSKNGSLVDIISGETIWQANEQEQITRGLAATDEYIFIGSSTRSVRKERKWTTGGIWIVDRKTFRTLDKLTIPGSGEVYELRIIGEVDECHNGQVINPKDVLAITRVSHFIEAAFNLRKDKPFLQRDWLPLSIPIRGVQMAGRWTRMMKQIFFKVS